MKGKKNKTPVLFFQYIAPEYCEGCVVTAKKNPCGLVEARANKSSSPLYFDHTPGLENPKIWKPITFAAYTKLNLILKAGTYVHGK